jgi:hypothetical protein
MLLRLLRGRKGRSGRSRRADRDGNGRVGQARSEAGASQAGVRQASAGQAGASQTGRPGSHRKTKASAAAGWPPNGLRSGPREPGRPAPPGAAVPGAAPPANRFRSATRAGAHRAGATSATGTVPGGTPSSTVPNSTHPNSTASSNSVSGSTFSSSTVSGSTVSSTVSGGAAARAAIRVAPDTPGAASVTGIAHPEQRPVAAKSDGQPWYAAAGSSGVDQGLRDCGVLERVLIREWDADALPPQETVSAINRLAGLPQLIKEKLAAGLEAIHVGGGGVPDLDHMGDLKGVPLPSGRATWDSCAGAYGDRKIIVGSRPSPTPDVMCHEVGHALDDLGGAAGMWQSDLADFAALYDRCLPHLAIEFHRRDGAFSRREFFADSFAAIASAQRPALVEMLSGNTRSALDVMLYFNVRYGI